MQVWSHTKSHTMEHIHVTDSSQANKFKGDLYLKSWTSHLNPPESGIRQIRKMGGAYRADSVFLV